MKRTHSVLLLTIALAFASFGQSVTAHDTNTAQSARAESLLIGPGDLLHITVFREPDLEQHVRVKDSGEIDLDLAGAVKVLGLTPGKAAGVIAQAYVQGQYLNHPQVSVLVEEYATQEVSALGQVAKPGAVPLTTPRSLVNVLSLAGGLTEIADRHITVQRGDKSGLITTFLPNNPQAALHASVMVYPGDTVIVPKAGVVYVLGDVARPGGYVMQDDSKLTLLQAIAIAAGANRTAKESVTRLIRKVNGSYQEQIISLKDIESGKKDDMQLEADDVLYVPFSMTKNVVLGASGIVSSTSSAAIYAVR
ncbi:MAG TPA: polysaccharide biosynthesis/export family protein [Pseudacidobacterium sp.]|jgi:polysaccharide export outer membrane protein|nr:polysaccharide biosynthesis/export family protein [Pseudacidobacterium sp.]